MAKSLDLPHEFAKALEGAGIITDLNSITRLVIDVQPGRLIEIHVQRVGDERLIDLAASLAGAKVVRSE